MCAKSADNTETIIQKKSGNETTISVAETYISDKYIRGKEFDRPSPGVIVPNHLEENEKIQWLMENDPAFKR